MPILYVDETGSRDRSQQGDWYVLGGTLTTEPDELSRVVRQTLARFYPGEKAELKSKKLRPAAREWLLEEINALPNTRAVVHAIYKPKVHSDKLLANHHQFYRCFYANLLKVVLHGHTQSVHVVTDGQHPDEDTFRHFENTVKMVNEYRVLSVNPVASERFHAVQAADAVVGTARYHLMGKTRDGRAWARVRPTAIGPTDSIFPRGYVPPNPL